MTRPRPTPIRSALARIQERSLALDDVQAMRGLFKKAKELEGILDSDDESEPVKAEALRDLEAIYELQRQRGRRSRDNAGRVAHVRPERHRSVPTSGFVGRSGKMGIRTRFFGLLPSISTSTF